MRPYAIVCYTMILYEPIWYTIVLFGIAYATECYNIIPYGTGTLGYHMLHYAVQWYIWNYALLL